MLSEKNRIANLLAYSALDAVPEREFNELVSLAAKNCGTPIALITLIDQKRVWVKAKFGTEVSDYARMNSCCSEVVSSKQFLWVRDLEAVTRFSHPPELGAQAFIRSYAGFPLFSAEGHVLGTLCVMDKMPREFTPNQMTMMEIFAQHTVALLERNRFRIENETQKKTLKENAKLATLGRLAGSILHEINNPLSILQSRASLLGIWAKEGKINAEIASDTSKKMLQATRRMAQIMSGFSSALGNEDQEGFTEISLHELIEDTLSFLIARFQNGQVDLDVIWPSKELKIICRPVQISQILINLLNNAYDAVFGAHLPRKWVRLEVTADDAQIFVSVMDAGRIIQPEVAKKVFTPFFTTKKIGKGTGLGLSISDDIARAHGGGIQLKEGTKYTTFILRLPRHFNPSPVAGQQLGH